MGEQPKISEIDLALIGLLQKDARRTNRELAETVGIAQSTCHERVRSLRARGIIRGWHADVDPAALGRPISALVSVRLQPKTTASVRAFQHDLLLVPETLAVWMVSGADDFVVEIAVPDVGRVRDFVLEHVTSRPDVVDARTALVYEQARAPFVAPL
ncbi:MAG: putative transcriptional regulator, AsnC family [Acidimicrobiales bacterium]|nr:putative transcriptional regulator, AsnC family [Acidimicrobiales bacterium]